MFDSSEMPPVANLYYEAHLLSASALAEENPCSSDRPLDLCPLREKDSQEQRLPDPPSLEPRIPTPGPDRPRHGPARLDNPDPVLPGLQIKLVFDFQPKIIIHSEEHQRVGPTT